MPDARHRRLAPKGVLIAALLTLVLSTACAPEKTMNPPSVFAPLNELSGLTATPDGRRLFGVTDEGRLAEFEVSGRILRDIEGVGEDLEGIASAPGGELWLLDERRDWIVRVSAASFEPRGKIRLPPFEERRDDNTGYEGLQVDDLGRLWLIHQEPATLLRLELNEGRAAVVVETLPIECESANDFLVLDDERGFVVLAKRQGLRLFDREGRPLSSWRPLPSEDFEGLAILPDHGLVLCTDTKPATLSVVDDIVDEDRLVKWLRSE